MSQSGSLKTDHFITSGSEVSHIVLNTRTMKSPDHPNPQAADPGGSMGS